MKSLKSSDEIFYVPSKTFLWGEYSAINGGHAGVVATTPCFAISKDEIKEKISGDVVSKILKFHHESPAGKFLEYCKKEFSLNDTECEELKSCHIYDPHAGQGGFGQSTAELVYVYKKMRQRIDMNPQSLWTLYRELAAQKTSPSGYDLMTQLSPGFNLMNVTGDQLRIESKPWPFTRLSFLLFKTKKKILTHEHLVTLDCEKLRPLSVTSEKISSEYLQGHQQGFLEGLKTFIQQLKDLDLVCAETLNIIQQIQSVAHVDAAKGCGALGADVVAVFCKKQYKTQVLKQIESSLADELRFIADEDHILFVEKI